MSEQKELFNELNEENMEQVIGGTGYPVGAHIECTHHIKWIVKSVCSSTFGPKYYCKAMFWPDTWNDWLKALNYETYVMENQIRGTW